VLVFVFSEIGYESRVHFLRVDLEVAYSIIISQPCQINLRRSEATADEICGEGGEKTLIRLFTVSVVSPKRGAEFGTEN